jgi:nitroimidazol reductase NimA-like FMN-containing flavoprotein (pyridoxamine 5'-phosphate oxidase superfamily)
MRIVDTRTGIEALDKETCIKLLATQEVGRLAIVDHGRPFIVPVNYALDGEAIVFRSGVGTKLDGISRSLAAFEVDQLQSATRSGWSVVVQGWAQEVTPLDRPDLLERLSRLEVHPWAPGDRPSLVRISPDIVTGRRIAPRPRAPQV